MKTIEFHFTESGDYTIAIDKSTGKMLSAGHDGLSCLLEDVLNFLGVEYERYEYSLEEFEKRF